MNISEMHKISNSFQVNGKAGASQSPVQTATEGKLQSVIFDTTKDCNVQKDMESSIVYNIQLNTQEVSTDAERTRLLSSDYVATSLSGEDVASLDQEGTFLGGYESSQIDQAISRVKEQRTQTEESIDRQVEKSRVVQEDLEQNAQVAAASQQLASAGLPITPENILRLTGAVDMSMSVGSFSFAQQSQLVQAGSPVTPGKVVASQGRTNMPTAPEDTFSQMEPQVQKLLTESGMVVDDEVMELAKELFQNNQPITKENVMLLQDIRQLSQLTPEQVTERIVDAMVDGMAPEDADLTLPSVSEAGEKLSELVNTPDTTIRKAFTTEADFIRAKRQLEEIRLEMTAASARQMIKRGIQVDLGHLNEIVEGLKEREKEATTSLLHETNTPVTPENIERYQDILTVKEQIQNAPAAILGQTLEEGMTQTVSEFTQKIAGVDLAETYEKVATEVRSDLGDSISKAFSHVDEMLDELGLPQTQMNQRAVRILGYNQMEITRESIGQVKEYDAKVNHLLEQMKPAAVAEMVQRRIDPMDMSLEELGETLSEIADEVQATDTSYEKYIWKMDRQGDLTPEERKSMIGVYRLLSNVEQTDGAVIGSLVRDGREITLNSLLSEVRSHKAQGIEAEVDDEFGGLTATTTTSETISDQIGAAYGDQLVRNLKRQLSPEVLREQENVMEMPLSELVEKCQTEDMTYYDEVAAQIRAVMSDAADTQNFLREMEMPSTLENIAIARHFLKDSDSPLSQLWSKEQSQEVVEQMDTEDGLNRAMEQVSEELQETANAQKKDSSMNYSQIQTLGLMGQSIAFYGKLRQRRMYEIPLVTESGVTTMNVTIEKGEADAGTARITMDSKVLGQCSATFSLEDHTVRGFITQDQPSEAGEWMDELAKDLEAGGFTVKEMTFAQGTRHSRPIGGGGGDSASTQSLYQVAKIFVQNVQRKEEAYENK